MAGLDKIIGQIQKESEDAAARTIAAAREKAENMLQQAREEAEAQCGEIRARSAKEKEDILERGRSAAELKVRQGLLAKKQEIIGSVLADALKAAKNLEAERYFQVIVRLAADAAMAGEGVVFFSEADLQRLPSDLERRMNDAVKDKGAVLKISSEPRVMDGGFILCYGGIEENCSFDAIFDSAREHLQDAVQRILFA